MIGGAGQSPAAALAAAATLGPFSAVAETAGPDWVSWTALVEDPGLLAGRVEEVRRLLAAGTGIPVPERVAASLVQLGLVGRLVAPPLGAALLTGIMPVSPPDRVRLRLSGPNPLPLALADATVVAVTSDLAAAFVRHWLGPCVEPLTVLVHREYRLSRRVLDGNTASAVAGALHTASTARPDLAPAAEQLLTALLASGPLAGAGARRDDGTFVRRSCCLFYRLPGAGTCGDCVLGAR
jgi:hypothetical protein